MATRASKIDISGSWSGRFEHPHWQFAALVELGPVTNGKVQGQIKWTMEKSPKKEEQPKLGLAAVEYVNGTFDTNNDSLQLNGYALNDPSNLGIALDSYTLKVSGDGNSMQGATTAHSDGLGKISLKLSHECAPPIVIEQTFPLDKQTMWTKWTDPSQLKSWLCGEAHTGTKPGELYELYWEPEHPDRNSTKGCKLLALKEGELLAFTWKGPVPYASIMNTSPEPTYATVELRSHGDRTTVILTHAGWHNMPDWLEARAWQERAWKRAFEQLQSVGSSHPTP